MSLTELPTVLFLEPFNLWEEGEKLSLLHPSFHWSPFNHITFLSAGCFLRSSCVEWRTGLLSEVSLRQRFKSFCLNLRAEPSLWQSLSFVCSLIDSSFVSLLPTFYSTSLFLFSVFVFFLRSVKTEYLHIEGCVLQKVTALCNWMVQTGFTRFDFHWRGINYSYCCLSANTFWQSKIIVFTEL